MENPLNNARRRANGYDFVKNQSHESNYISNIVNQCFSKKFSFEIDELWELPSQSQGISVLGEEFDKRVHERWQIDELEELKLKLNSVKSKLNTYNFGDWHKHTRSRNPAGLIMRDLRNFEIELLTQAWCKFYELLNVYNIVSNNNKTTLRTFHLCEAPGAFICSLNHFLKLNHPSLEWQWFASTLNPYHEGNSLDEMINDDRFISKTLKNWWFGEDYTGNLRHRSNLDDLKKFTSTLGSIHLVTADGSVDCCKNPGDQETYVLPLHYSEMIAALNILSPGGNFVIKIFTIYECETICLLYLLCCVFKHVSVHKPVVSKEGNSEVYVICQNYGGKEKCRCILDNADYYGRFPRVLFRKEDLPKPFIEQIIKCSKFFTTTQISILEGNINSYHSQLSKKKKITLWKVRTKVAEKFLQSFNIYPLIDPSEYVLGGLYLSNPLQLDQKNEDGSFEDRVESIQPAKRELLLNYQRILEPFQIAWDWPFIYWIKDWNNKETNASDFTIIRGQPISSIRSSKFCKGSLLKVVNDLQNYQVSELLLHNDNCSLTKLNEELSSLNLEYFICNVYNNFWLSDFHTAQKECLKCLILHLSDMKLTGSFVLTGLPLLTQFNIGLLYVLGLSFGEVGIISPEIGYAVIFKNLLNFEFLDKLKELDEDLNKSKSGILSVFPISRFLEGELYNCITICNHLVIKKSALESIKTLLDDMPQSNAVENSDDS
ncbi:cap-specific mRNA (nucleoside-2'-O-)-methyltransferase 2 [Halyomorpha halys]|uniref:cap-specific mRNA (nucleoside-2'-O-)-methyltransferase 2 n=1 Tax=Halyomorpha halys TaxID=286706 RepID=UPI0006D4D508|nr:cap-specific mRNA (nucleoside-2'-O-)-methyltransferase 2 [Halyomorpha halys]